MAFVEISSQRASSTPAGFTASRAVTFPGNVTAGNLVVVGGSFEVGNALPFLTVTGGGGPTAASDLIIRPSTYGAGGIGRTFLALGIVRATGACTITMTYRTVSDTAVSAYGNLSVTEFTGVGGMVGYIEAQANSTAPAPGTLTVDNGDLLLGATNYRAVTTITAPSGWTQIGESETWVDPPYQFAFKIATATGTETPAWTLAGAGPWDAIAVIVRESGGSSGGGGGSYAFIG